MSDTETTAAATDVAMLESLDPASREVAVTSMLDQARQWLERAKESTTPAQDVAEFKAFVATVAEAAKQKDLSEAIQLDALEMVRRSERALGLAVRQGQESGAIANRTNRGYQGNQHGKPLNPTMSGLTSPSDYFTGESELADAYAMTDIPTDAEFESALQSAKEDGNLSRRNVVAKVKEISSYRDQQTDKWAKVADLATRGNTSPQIAREVGMSEGGLRTAAARKGITFPADKLSNFKRIDPLYVVEQIVLGLEVTETTLDLVTYENVSPEQAAQWLERLASPLRAIRKMQTELKEIN